MSRIPKRVVERYMRTVPKFERVLKAAQDRDITEADTVSITKDMLAEVFGFDKYQDITAEYVIRGTYCDLAIKVDDKIQYLIEVKAIGLTLKETHLRQAVDYGSKEGVQWVILTNGIIWEVYRILFEKPIDYQLVCVFNFLQLNPRKAEDQEKLFLLSKKGLKKKAREDYYERVQSLNRFVIGAIVLTKPIVTAIRRDVRKLSSGIKVSVSEIEKILRNEVLKRDVIEGEDASKAATITRRLTRTTTKRSGTRKGKEARLPSDSQIAVSAELPEKDEKGQV